MRAFILHRSEAALFIAEQRHGAPGNLFRNDLPS
jgi:hypothetical protein